MLSLVLALAMCLGLTVPAFAAGTVKVVENKTQGVKITLNGFLREETRSYNVWVSTEYDEDTGEEITIVEPHEFTIYVVADNSTVTIEALAGRKYADASLQGLNRWIVAPGSPNYNSSVREAWITFLDNRENYAYSCEGDGGTTDWWVWDGEGKFIYGDYNFTWPLDKAVTETVSPKDQYQFLNLSTGYGIDWMCESDYAKLVPVDGGQPTQPTDPVQPTVPTVGNFTDVTENDWFAGPVLWAVEHGITSGTSETAFSPNQNCTVAQILTFLWKACGSPQAAGSNPFSDVSSGDYYANAAAWAYEKGMVSGKTFGGDTPCTRSMAVTYLWKAAGSPDAGTPDFTDVPAGADYAGAVAWAVERDVTSGTSNTTFSPDSVCTRGQIVTFLYQGLAK